VHQASLCPCKEWNLTPQLRSTDPCRTVERSHTFATGFTPLRAANQNTASYTLCLSRQSVPTYTITMRKRTADPYRTAEADLAALSLLPHVRRYTQWFFNYRGPCRRVEANLGACSSCQVQLLRRWATSYSFSFCELADTLNNVRYHIIYWVELIKLITNFYLFLFTYLFLIIFLVYFVLFRATTGWRLQIVYDGRYDRSAIVRVSDLPGRHRLHSSSSHQLQV